MAVVETEVLVWFCEKALRAQRDIVVGLGDELANRRPDLPGANSPYAILTHSLGVMAYWSSTVNLGVEVPRDRAAEFTATGPVEELAARVEPALEAFREAALAAKGSAPPANPPSHRHDAWLGTRGGILLHVYEELAQHLGQLEITRDLLRAGD